MGVLSETLGLGVRPRAFHKLLEISQKGCLKVTLKKPFFFALALPLLSVAKVQQK